jgi:hypothetical protein
MLKKALSCALFIGFIAPTAALADRDNSLARFEGGIGSQPLRAGGTPNLVFGLNPGGAPWVIADLSVDVKTDGRISVDGRGLLLGGGNGIGTPAGQSVRARLVCGGVFFDTGLVPLEADGGFRFNDQLVPVPPNPCTGAALLIVNTGGSWFAAGIPKLRSGD